MADNTSNNNNNGLKLEESPKEIEIQCLPLYSILLALDVTTVDFFSLDIEGSELEILKTIPFDKVTFKVGNYTYLVLFQG